MKLDEKTSIKSYIPVVFEDNLATGPEFLGEISNGAENLRTSHQVRWYCAQGCSAAIDKGESEISGNTSFVWYVPLSYIQNDTLLINC